MKRSGRKIELKILVPDVVETRAAIKVCLQTERFDMLQRGGDVPEIKKYSI